MFETMNIKAARHWMDLASRMLREECGYTTATPLQFGYNFQLDHVELRLYVEDHDQEVFAADCRFLSHIIYVLCVRELTPENLREALPPAKQERINKASLIDKWAYEDENPGHYS
jgi:hypothetical protein